MSQVTNGYLNNYHGSVRTKSENIYSYEIIKSIADFLLDHIGDLRPTVGIICGSGLGHLGDTLSGSVSFPYENIPHFPQSTVPGHAGKLVFGKIDNTTVVCMQGRFHSYEGYPLWKCSMPVRLMKLIGVTHLVVTNAAGGLNPEYKVGDIMIIKDHVNFMGFGGNNPMMGHNDERFGPRFFPMNRAYDLQLRQMAKTIAKNLGLDSCLREGVYTAIGGPNFETIAECRMLRVFGVDAVGMSTIPEVLTARHAGMTVFAFSLITNKCILDYDSPDEPTHEEVMDVGKLREPVLKKFVCQIVRQIPYMHNGASLNYQNGCKSQDGVKCQNGLNYQNGGDSIDCENCRNGINC